MADEIIRKAGVGRMKSRSGPLSDVGEIEVKWGNNLEFGATFPLAEHGRHSEYARNDGMTAKWHRLQVKCPKMPQN